MRNAPTADAAGSADSPTLSSPSRSSTSGTVASAGLSLLECEEDDERDRHAEDACGCVATAGWGRDAEDACECLQSAATPLRGTALACDSFS
mmetsp:Transcript_87641/g.188013  ORF Transcript_87641/g.188013 Transcript_87641/m.188013 type:complete len:92 (+) Transcript_87641:51-326(+)